MLAFHYELIKKQREIWVISFPYQNSIRLYHCHVSFAVGSSKGVVPFPHLMTTTCGDSALPGIYASQKELVRSSDHVPRFWSNANSKQHIAIFLLDHRAHKNLTLYGEFNFRSLLRWSVSLSRYHKEWWQQEWDKRATDRVYLTYCLALKGASYLQRMILDYSVPDMTNAVILKKKKKKVFE